MDIATIRNQIPATRNVIYFNTGFSGPSPQPVVDAIVRILQFESEEGPTSPQVQQKLREDRSATRGTFAGMLGASAEEITLTDNTTHGINIVLNGLPWQSGDEIVTDDLEHASGLVPAYHLREHHDVAVRIVQLTAQDDTETILRILEDAVTPRTKLFLLSHIMYTTGLCIPLAEIQQLAHSKGVRVLVDGAQSLGHVPLDMHALHCDYYAVPAHKWLLGPGGVGALYTQRDLLPELTPTAVSSKAALSYDQAGHYEPSMSSPEKFELTTSSSPLLAGAAAAIQFLQEIGMDHIQARWQDLTAYLRGRLSTVPGITVTSPSAGPTASGLVTFAAEGWEPRALVNALWEREKIVIRPVPYPSGVRVSVDFFNTEQELDCVVDTLRTLLREGPPQ